MFELFMFFSLWLCWFSLFVPCKCVETEQNWKKSNKGCTGRIRLFHNRFMTGYRIWLLDFRPNTGYQKRPNVLHTKVLFYHIKLQPKLRRIKNFINLICLNSFTFFQFFHYFGSFSHLFSLFDQLNNGTKKYNPNNKNTFLR